MCELLGMSANVPTDICFSFTGLMLRGGKTGPHKDGWGITFTKGKAFVPSGSRAQCPVADCQAGAGAAHQEPRRGQPYSAGQPRLRLAGEYPPFYPRAVGSLLDLAHNGQLTGYKGYHRSPSTGGRHRQRTRLLLAARSAGTEISPTPCQLPAMFRYLATLCNELRGLGVFNMLLSDGSS